MGDEGKARHEGASEKMSIEDAVFGVLFTLQKEQNGSDGLKGKLIIVAKFIIEFVQLFLFVFAGNQVGEWGWHVSFDRVFWKWFNYLQAENPMTNAPTGSYELWLVFFYLLAAVLMLSLGLCVFVASCFKSGSFPVVWPVKLLRAIVSVVFSVLFVSSLDVFLVGVACIPDPVHPDRKCVLYNFTSYEFLGFPHIIHGIIAVLMTITIITISSLISVADSEQNFLTKELMASFDSAYAMRRFICCTVLTLASNFLVGYLKLLSVLLFLLFLAMFYDSLRLPPYYHEAANHLNAVCGSLLVWASLLLVAKMYTSGPIPHEELFGWHADEPPAFAAEAGGFVNATAPRPPGANATLMPPLLPPLPSPRLPPPSLAAASGLSGALLTPPGPPASGGWNNGLLLTQIGFYASPGIALLAMGVTKLILLRNRRYFDIALAKVKEMESAAGERVRLQPTAVAEALGDSIVFSSIPHVELALRPLRQALWDKNATPESKDRATLAAEALALIGMRQFAGGKKAALMYIMYGCFLIELTGNHVRGYSYLDKARNMRLSMRERFMIFARDRERTHRAQGDSVGSGAMDLVSYVEFTSSFANLLRQHRSALRATRSFWRLLVSPTILFASLSAAFKQMDETEALADSTYRSVLKKYPKSVKLLRAYAAFLEEVRNNPWAARKYREDADKLEETIAEDGDDHGVQQVSDSDAVVVVDGTAVITVVNHAFLKLFGYKKQEEVIGRNVGILAPPPHDKLHTSYIDNYMRTGEGRILGMRQQLIAKNAKGENLPVTLLVSKIETNGETAFMGILSQREDGARDFAEMGGGDSGSERSGSAAGSESPGIRVAEVRVGAGGKPLDAAGFMNKPGSMRPTVNLDGPGAPNARGPSWRPGVGAGIIKSASAKPGAVVAPLPEEGAFVKVASYRPGAPVAPLPVPVDPPSPSPPAMGAEVGGGAPAEGQPSGGAASRQPSHGAASRQASAVVADRQGSGSTAASADRHNSESPRVIASWAEGPGPVAESVAESARRLGAAAAAPHAKHEATGGLSAAPAGAVPQDVIERARSGGCIFFAAEAAPHPVKAGASQASCPFIASRAAGGSFGGSSGAAAASAPPPPPPSPYRPPEAIEAAIALQQLQSSWLRPPPARDSAQLGRSADSAAEREASARGAFVAAAAAQSLRPRTEREWDALLAGFRHMLPGAASADHSDSKADTTDMGQLQRPLAAATLDSGAEEPAGDTAAQQRPVGRANGPRAVTEAFESSPSADWEQLLNPPANPPAAAAAQRGSATAEPPLAENGARALPSQQSSLATGTGGPWGQPSNGAPLTASQAAVAVAAKMHAVQMARTGSNMASFRGEMAFSPRAGGGIAGAAMQLMQLQAASSQPLQVAVRPQAEPSDRVPPEPAEKEEDIQDAQSSYKQHAAEFQRARRFRQLGKLLNSLQMRKSVVVLNDRTRYILALLVLAYVTGFVLMQVEFTHYDHAIDRLRRVGQLTERTISAAIEVTAIAALQRRPPVNLSATVEVAQQRLLGMADDMRLLQHGLFLGFNDERKYPDDDVYQAMIAPTVNETQWSPAFDRAPFGGRPLWKLVSPWKAMRRFEMHSRVLGMTFDPDMTFADSPTRLYMGNDRDVEYVLTNVRDVYDALRNIQELDSWAQRKEVDSHQTTSISIMVALIVVCGSSLLYFRHLLEEVAKARIVLFQVFLIVPIGIVAKLGAKSLRTAAVDADEQWDGDDDLDDAWDPQQAAAGAVPTGSALGDFAMINTAYAVGASSKLGRVVNKVITAKRVSVHFWGRARTAVSGRLRRWSSNIAFPAGASEMTNVAKVKINTGDDRVLDHAGAAADSYAFLLPLIIFSVLSVAAFGASFQLLQTSEGPLINLDSSNVELVQAARVRLFATQAVIAASTGADNATVRALQAEMRDAATILLAQHQLLMTGAPYPGLHGNTVGSDLPEREHLMFVEQCLRFAEEECLPGDHPFWTRVHHGLNALLRYYVNVALLLSHDPVSSLSTRNDRFRFIWLAGGGDLHDGLIRNRELYYQSALDTPKAAKGLLIAALPIVCVGSYMFLQRYFGPWTKRTLHESKVVAELLAQLPKELNVEAMLMEAMGVAGAKEQAAQDTSTVGLPAGKRRGSEAKGEAKKGSRRSFAADRGARVSMARGSMRGSVNSVVPLREGDSAVSMGARSGVNPFASSTPTAFGANHRVSFSVAQTDKLLAAALGTGDLMRRASMDARQSSAAANKPHF